MTAMAQDDSASVSCGTNDSAAELGSSVVKLGSSTPPGNFSMVFDFAKNGNLNAVVPANNTGSIQPIQNETNKNQLQLGAFSAEVLGV